MAGPELFLDSSIRIWVVLPIVFITFLVGVIRHYVTQLLHSDKKVELEQVSDSQVLLRSRILRENGKYLPKQIDRKYCADVSVVNDYHSPLSATISPVCSLRNGHLIGLQLAASLNSTSKRPASTSTVKMQLQDAGLLDLIGKKSCLRIANKKKRLRWANKHTGQCGGRSNEKTLEECLITSLKHGGGNVMVLGCLADGKVRDLYRVKGILKTEGYHSATPCHTLWTALNWSQFRRTTGQRPKHSYKAFAMRKHYFNNAESGFFKKVKRKVIPKNPMTDTSMVTDMMKGNLTNVLPMILIGGWINWAFSGFVTTKVPFPLTLRFKPMLQRGIELLSLDASWVSSASWYFLNVFGLRSMYNLLLGHNNADQSSIMQDHMTGAAMPVPPDPNKAFKSEWEALEIVNHHWALESVEEELLCRDLNFGGMFSRELKTTMF